MLPISTDILRKEIQSIRDTVDKWCAKLEEGVPGVDRPASGMGGDTRLDVWLTEFIGEMRLISGKATTLSEVMSNTYLE